MKLFPLIAVFLLAASVALGQGVFKFEKESHNFGEIPEGKKAEFQFKFTNVGNAPIVIANVSASCGCTTPEWTRQPIPPGGTGVVTAAYDSEGRPGNFNKSITITSNATEGMKVLQISGVVTTDPAAMAAHNSQALQPAGGNAPAIKFAQNQYNFGTLQVGERFTRKFEYTNTGKADLKITSVFSKCRCVTFKTSKAVLLPGETASIEIVFTPTAASDKPEKIFIASNAPYDANNAITLTGKVVESLTPKSIMQESDGIKF